MHSLSLKVIFVFSVAVLLLVSYPETALSKEVSIGDRREDVIQALGEPNGATTFADMEVLYYLHGQVKMKKGSVVSHSLLIPEEVVESHRGTSVSNEVNIGDSRDDVVQALGQPKGTTTFAGTEVLHYPRGRVEMESGRVASYSLMTPEELAALTAKRLKEEEARRERDALRRAAQAAEEEKQALLSESMKMQSITPRKNFARDLYKIGTSSATPLGETYKKRILESDFYPEPDWKKYHATHVPYIIAKQGTDPMETALYRKHPMSNTEGTLFFNVRRNDFNKTLTLHTRSSGDKPKYLMQFNGKGEVPVYRFESESKLPNWTYLVMRDGDEKEGRLDVYQTQRGVNSRLPSLIIKTDHEVGKTAVFRTVAGIRRLQDIPVRIYTMQKAGSLSPSCSAEVIGIIAAIDILRRK